MTGRAFPSAQILFAFYQVVSAIPRVYSVDMPARYYELMQVFELTELAQIFSELVVPSACFTGAPFPLLTWPLPTVCFTCPPPQVEWSRNCSYSHFRLSL